MASEIGFNDLLNFLIQNKEQKFLITFHSMGDRDCIGAALGLQSYLSNSVVATPDFVTSTSKRVLEGLSNKPELLTGKVPKDIFGVIIVDANTFEALGPFEEKLGGLKKPILFIDHHLPHKEEKSKATIFNDENFNSTSSLVYSIISKLGVRPSRDVAFALLNGIIADSFDFHNMHALTFRQIAELLEGGGISYSRFMEEFADRVPAQNRLIALKDLASASAQVIGKYLLITGTSSIHASIAAEEAMKVGADASVFWQIGEKEVSISARLKPPLDKRLSVHLGRMMQGIEGMINGHGGGHSGAAGAYGPGKANAKKAVDKIILQLRQKLEE